MSNEKMQDALHGAKDEQKAIDQWWYEPPLPVWKFVLPMPTDESGIVEVVMPSYAEIIHVDQDTNSIFGAIWAKVDPDSENRTVKFVIVPTGKPVQSTHEHIGSFQVDGIGGRLMFHVYRHIPWASLNGGYAAPEGED